MAVSERTGAVTGRIESEALHVCNLVPLGAHWEVALLKIAAY